MATELPAAQYVDAEHVIDEMARFGFDRLHRLDPLRTLVLAVMAGGFITAGGLFSVLVGAGVESAGLQRLVEGFAFSAGFFFVVLSSAVLFTEANVVLPATLLTSKVGAARVARFWAIAWVGNLVGALVVAHLVATAQTYPAPVLELLGELVDRKLAYADAGTPAAWGQAVLSGVLANWLVGMAAFFATMGRTILGKYVPVALAVMIFVAANFQHSPANMGFFALWMAETGQGPGWATALWWNIVPAGVGNMVGAALLVAAPFWYAFRPPVAVVPPEARDAGRDAG